MAVGVLFVETKQDSSIGVDDLPEILVGKSRFQ
jgi:hypothetical protein